MTDGRPQMPTLELRPVPYGHPDAALLTDLAQSYYVSIYGSPDSAPVSDDGFAPPNGAFFVGYLDGEPVSMGGWRFSDAGVPAEATRPAEVKRMYVRDEVRGRGLARRTLALLEADARRAGADWLILETGRPQVAAVAFYRAAGYRDIEPFGYYAGWANSVTLGKPLTGDDPALVLTR
jgi:GNAT superfamily N-acetyltransferase